MHSLSRVASSHALISSSILECLHLSQAFFEFFEALPGQQRLIGYTMYGDTYYAGPGQWQGPFWV